MRLLLAVVLSAMIPVSPSASLQNPVVWSIERADTAPLKPGGTFTVLVKACLLYTSPSPRD